MVHGQVTAFGDVLPGASIRVSDLGQDQTLPLFVLEWIVYGSSPPPPSPPAGGGVCGIACG